LGQPEVNKTMGAPGASKNTSNRVGLSKTRCAISSIIFCAVHEDELVLAGADFGAILERFVPYLDSTEFECSLAP
jgi:hypothetical protein